MEFVNWPLLKHPANWLTVVLMVLIGGALVHFVVLQSKIAAQQN
jgi:hypothetical protein